MHQDDSLGTRQPWSGEERRGIDGITLKLMAEVRATMETHEKMEQRQFKSLENRIETLGGQVSGLQATLLTFMEKAPKEIVERIEILIDEAFPDDPEMPDATPSEKRKLHRKYHAKLIRDAIDEHLRNRSLAEKLLSHVLNNAVTLIGLALLAYFGIAHK